MSNITDKTKGLIIIGDTLYKLKADDLKALEDLTDNQESYWRGNKHRTIRNTEEFLVCVEENYKPIGKIHSIHD